MTDELAQLKAVRESGEANMIDRFSVQRAANEREFFELVTFIENNGLEAYSDLLMRT